MPVAVEGTYRLMGKHAVDTGDDKQRHWRVVRVQIGAALQQMCREGVPQDVGADVRAQARFSR